MAEPERGALSDVRTVVYQLQNYEDGSLEALAHAGYDLAIIDPAGDHGLPFSRSEIAALRSTGTRVLAYFEIGSIEDFRPEYAEIRRDHPDLLLNEWPTWPGEYFARYWDSRWWELVVRPRVDQALAAGFDGLYMDTPLAYEEIDLNRLPGATRDVLGRNMADLIVRISTYAKQLEPHTWIVPQNSPELRRHPGYTEAIDAIGMEEMFFQATDVPCTEDYCATNLAEARALRRSGKTVLAIDYAERPENVAYACLRYKEEGFVGYVTNRLLDNLHPPCA